LPFVLILFWCLRPLQNYLHSLVVVSLDLEVRYLEDVFYTCLQRNCPIVLIEEDLRGPGLSVLDIHQIVSEGSKRTWPTVRRIAYVDANKEHSQSDMHFAETVAVNLGVNVKLFPTVKDAEEWLRDVAAPTDT